VGDFLSLIRGPARVASCLHADTLEELAGILCSAPLGVSPASLGRVGLILFMHADRGLRGVRRRVATFYEADGRGGHRCLFEWDAASDTFTQAGDLREPDQLGRYMDFIRRLVEDGEVHTPAVRRKIVGFYRRGKG